ncbi:MAG TPA: nitroreductase [Actinophytocola sp.]|uniref:nitroreductase n=1 Tax=Actinophytocola sp. TaxID=1872138 RepID=UPI002DB813DB|nr:nitroreductase [Actinophytocola sp.]HEU5475952.1 nitroreductase [Actinophytocola sp.]
MDAFLWNGLFAVLGARHCKRAFTDRPVQRDLLERVLRAAAHAPSTRNGQPWQVAVVSGQNRDSLARRLCADFDNGVAVKPDYPNRPVLPDERIEARAREAGAGVLSAKGIDRADAAGRRAHLRDNYDFYGAPTAMIFHLPAEAPPGMFLEMGFFLQNVMLGLVACGLGSCPQYSVAGYADSIRAELGLGADRLIVCGLAVGYPDETVAVNTFHPRRAELEDYVQWHDRA